MKVLVFGNLFVEGDNLALSFLGRLRGSFLKIEFFEADPTEEIQEFGRHLNIIDSVVGIDKCREVELFSQRDFDRLENGGSGMHDFDLNYNLRLAKKMGLVDSVRILCVPMSIDGDKEKVYSDIQFILRKWVAQDMQGS